MTYRKVHNRQSCLPHQRRSELAEIVNNLHKLNQKENANELSEQFAGEYYNISDFSHWLMFIACCIQIM